VLGEGSGFDKGVYVWRVSMPLFVPSEEIILSYSTRVGSPTKLRDGSAETFRQAIVDAFEGFPTETGELKRMADLASGSRNLRVIEVAAYSMVLLGDRVQALAAIDQTTQLKAVARTWEKEILARLNDLRSLLESNDLEAAMRRISKQERFSASALGIAYAPEGVA
jgi:hypothetical protein